jgi:hypothetical protein
MASDVWVGAVATLVGAALGGAISFVLSRQQIKAARSQREAELAQEQLQRSRDRRFDAYSEFLVRARSFRNGLKAYYLPTDHRPTIDDVDTLLHAAQDASTLVFLVVESEEAFKACIGVVRALGNAQALVHGVKSSASNEPWRELNQVLGHATRDFQNAVRKELEVSGPAIPWDSKFRGGQKRASDETRVDLNARQASPDP